MRVAIIGMGTAGVSVLKELVEHPKFNQLDIDLYDNKVNMGQGVLFQNDSPELLISMSSKEISLNSDDETKLRKWYKQQTDSSFDEPAHLPRFAFGHYMKSYLSIFTKEYPDISTNYDKAQEIYTNSDIDETNLTCYICTINSGQSWQVYDYVFLTCGTFTYHDPYNLKDKKRYIATPYPACNTLSEVSELDNVAIIGTGLASLNIVRCVAAHHPELLVTMTSRSARLPSIRGTMTDVTFKYLTKDKLNDTKKHHFGNAPLDTLVSLFLKECADYDIDFKKLVHKRMGNHIADLKYDLTRPTEMGVFQSMIERLKESLNWIWNSLSIEDQHQLNQKYSEMIQLNSNPMPPRTAKLIIELIENKSLTLKKDLEDVKRDDKLYYFSYENRESVDIYNVVINMTDTKSHLDELDQDNQLIKNLKNKQIVQTHPMGDIQIVPETNQVISPRFGTLTNMIAVSRTVNGVNELRNSIKMIVEQVAHTVSQLYNALESDEQQQRSDNQ